MIFVVLYISIKMRVERPYKETGLFFLTVPYIHLVFSEAIDEEQTGLLCTSLNVFIYLVLLDKVKAVLEQKDAELVNLPLSIACLLNASTWGAYAVLVKNAYMFIPNAIGVACAAL